MCHVSDRAKLQGNPWFYTTFYDESLNKELKKVLRLCHQANFESLGLQKVVSVLETRANTGSPRVSTDATRLVESKTRRAITCTRTSVNSPAQSPAPTLR